MSEGAIGERYAQALFELGVEAGNVSVLAEKIRAFALVYREQHELRTAFSNPLVPPDERKAALLAIARRLQIPEIGIKGLSVIADRRRLGSIGVISDALTELVDDKDQVVRASVTTAKKMPESFYASLSKKLAAATGSKVVLERHEDPSLIGGAITRVGDAYVDGSVRGQLDNLERQFVRALSVSAS